MERFPARVACIVHQSLKGRAKPDNLIPAIHTTNEVKMKIEKLNNWDMQCKEVADGYDYKSVPDLTAGNIEVLMNKMNEIIEVINEQVD